MASARQRTAWPSGPGALVDTKTSVATVHDASKFDFVPNPFLNLTVTMDDEDADTMADNTLNLDNGNEAPIITATGAVLKITDLSRLPPAEVVTISGAKANEWLGGSVSSAGDVNGDGIDDFIVGAPDTSASPGAGAAYVIYGKAGGLSSFSVANLTAADGFKITGATAKDQAGYSVSSAGDLNGDGIDDLLIGAQNADKPVNASASAAAPGAAYVVYGKAGGSGDIDLGNLTATDGFKISAGVAIGRAGYSVAAAGDINKDGIDDIIVGATLIGVTATSSGSAYVIYGKKDGLGAVDLSKLTESQGFVLGARQYDGVGTSVSGIGDVNGDGIDDMVIGAPGSDLNGSNSGTAFVVYGNADGLAKFNMSTEMGTKGFKIIGAASGNALGSAVSAAGDVNGDGIADIIVATNKAESGKGAAYVIYGTKSAHEDVTLSSLNAQTGFKIVGAANGDGAGYSVSGAGDVNGDGIGDLLVGATGSDLNGTESGTTYVVFGTKEERGTLDLSALTPDQGVALEGPGNLSGAGYSVAAAGDLNGDGIADLIVGAPNANSDGSGAAFVIYGRKGFAPFAPVEGTTATLTYIDLQKVAAVSDMDSNTVSYKVMALGEGTLTVDGAAAVAGETLITPTSVVTWTPPANTTGTLGAFTLAAFDGTATSTTTVPVQIAVADVDPVLTGPATASLAENSPVGTEVAKLQVSGDQDGLTFGFADSSATEDGKAISADGAFAIDTKTGIVTVNDASKLDFETNASFKLTLTVDDEDADSLPDSTLTLAISLTDTNDAPVLTGLPGTAVAAIAGQPLALPAFTVTDQDSTLFAVTLSTVNGTLSGLVDGDAGKAGIQLSGTAADIQALLAAATFTPIVDGEARVNLTVSDGAGGTAIGALPFLVSTPLGSTVAIGEAIVTTKTETETDGTLKQTVTVPAVTDNGGNPAPADIPLVKDNADTLLSATLPPGVGLTATGTPTAQASELSLLELIAQIQKHTPDGSTEQAQLTAGGTDFLEDLPSNTLLLVQTLVLTGTDTAGTPIVVSAPAGTAPIALVVDASALPPGTQINFENVAFAAVVGPVTLGGGSGAQVVYADDAPQTIMLGADNDELHGGGGNDTVGSAGGDDRIFGEAGDDIVFGGPGRDLLHGGLGTDTARFDGNQADYEILQDRGVTVVRSLSDPTDVDTLVNVESLSFADGKLDLTVSEDIKEIAALYANVLGRQADLDGMQYYAGLVERGLSIGNIALAFLTSPEAIAKGTGAAAGDLTVEQLYRTLFGREPDADGLAYHKAQLAEGVPMADVVAHFVTSPEMVTHQPAATGLDFVVDADLEAGNVTGTSGDDQLEGGALDDRLISNGGQDVIDGHAGDDTVVLSGNRADFSIEEKDVHWVVKPIIVPNLPHGGALLAVAILKNIEHVQFDDGTIDLTANSDLGWIGALYTQVLGRQGDEGGLMAHLADYQGGMSKGAVALSFMLSPEAIAVGHGAASAEDLTADTVYQALLGHAPTEADHATYGSLESDVLALANALMGSQEMHGHYLTPQQQDFFI